MQRFQSTMWTMIGKAGAGSKSAVNKLLARYNGPILGFLKQKGLSDEDAEDVAQEVFLQVSAKEFLARADRSKGKFRTLLLRVTRNVLNSEYRKRYSQKRGGEKKRIPMEHLQDVAVSPEDQDQFDRLWAENLIRLGLEKLRADSSRLRVAYHDVLVKRFFEGKSQREIAESMGIKDHDVENYIRNGKERLGRHIAKLGEEYCSSEDEWEEERGLLQRFSP